MKRMLMAGAFALAAGGQALAADLPQPAPPPPPRAPATYVPVPAPVFTWTGIYVGINGGYEFGTSNWTSPTGTLILGVPCTTNCSTGNFNTNGYLVGATIGANYQWGQFVFGVEGDGDWANITGNTTTNCGSTVCTTQSQWLATARGRAGFAWDRVLFYGTAGGAAGNIQAAAGGLPFASSTQFGWTGGAGIEAALFPNVTAKIEYLYVNLGSMSCPGASCAATATTVPLTENVVRVGINYKFW